MGDYLFSMKLNMNMFETLHNVHVVANISVKCHKLCYLCIQGSGHTGWRAVRPGWAAQPGRVQ